MGQDGTGTTASLGGNGGPGSTYYFPPSGSGGTASVPDPNQGGIQVGNNLFNVVRGIVAGSSYVRFAGGGGGGGGNSQVTGGDGGGGGGGGGGICLVIAQIIRGTGTIRANGGDGGEGSGSDASGGGGGGGGAVIVVSSEVSDGITLQANGGTQGSIPSFPQVNGSPGNVFQIVV